MKTHGTLRYAPPRDQVSRRGAWLIEASPPVMIQAARMFPRATALRQGQLMLWDTPEIARDLEWLCERFPLLMDERAAATLARGADHHRATERAIEEILTGARPRLDGGHLLEVASGREHRDYQYAAADLALTTRGLLLADDLGTGKSMSCLLALRDPETLPALIVCQTHLPAQWEREVAETFPTLRTHIVRQLEPYDPAAHRSMRGYDPDVLIVPYSKLRGWGWHLAGKVRTVIFDEAQELRKRGSQKYDAAARIADGATLRIGATATPVYNYGGEIWSIIDILAPGVLGTNEEFGREWCVAGYTEKARVKDPAALGIYLREQGVMLRRTRKELGRELPEVVRVVHAIDADEDVLEQTAEDALQLAELIVARAAPREELWRASGDFDWRMRHATGVAKAPYVAEFVKLLLETGEQVVLYGWHRDVYALWTERLAAWSPAFYTGTESPKQKQAARDAFVARDTQLLIMSLRAGAGLDGLQGAGHVAVFGELDWSPGMHDQCIGRLHRDGQDESVVAYFLVSDHGSDPVVAEVLGLKRQQSEPLRNPDAPLFETADTTGDRIRRLAEDVLARRQRRSAA